MDISASVRQWRLNSASQANSATRLTWRLPRSMLRFVQRKWRRKGSELLPWKAQCIPCIETSAIRDLLWRGTMRGKRTTEMYLPSSVPVSRVWNSAELVFLFQERKYATHYLTFDLFFRLLLSLNSWTTVQTRTCVGMKHYLHGFQGPRSSTIDSFIHQLIDRSLHRMPDWLNQSFIHFQSFVFDFSVTEATFNSLQNINLIVH